MVSRQKITLKAEYPEKPHLKIIRNGFEKSIYFSFVHFIQHTSANKLFDFGNLNAMMFLRLS